MNPEPSDNVKSAQEAEVEEARSRFLNSIGLGFGGQRAFDGESPVSEERPVDGGHGRVSVSQEGVALSSQPDDLELPGVARADDSPGEDEFEDIPSENHGEEEMTVSADSQAEASVEKALEEEGADEEVLNLQCPNCEGELALNRIHLGVPGACVWCQTPIVAAESAQDKAVRIFLIGSPPEAEAKHAAPATDERSSEESVAETEAEESKIQEEIEEPALEETEAAAETAVDDVDGESVAAKGFGGFDAPDSAMAEDVAEEPVPELESEEEVDPFAGFAGFGDAEVDEANQEPVSEEKSEKPGGLPAMDLPEPEGIPTGFAQLSDVKTEKPEGAPQGSEEPDSKEPGLPDAGFAGFSGVALDEVEPEEVDEPLLGFDSFSDFEPAEAAEKEAAKPENEKVERQEDLPGGFGMLEEVPDKEEEMDAEEDPVPFGFGDWSGDISESGEDASPVSSGHKFEFGTEKKEEEMPSGFSGEMDSTKAEAETGMGGEAEESIADFAKGFESGEEKKSTEETAIFGFGGLDEETPKAETGNDAIPSGFGDFLSHPGGVEDSVEPSKEDTVESAFGSLWDMPGDTPSAKPDSGKEAKGTEAPGFEAAAMEPWGAADEAPAPVGKEEDIFSASVTQDDSHEFFGGFESPTEMDASPVEVSGAAPPAKPEVAPGSSFGMPAEKPTASEGSSGFGFEATGAAWGEPKVSEKSDPPAQSTDFASMKEDEAPSAFSEFGALDEKPEPTAESVAVPGESPLGKSSPFSADPVEPPVMSKSPESSMFGSADAFPSASQESPFGPVPEVAGASPFAASEPVSGFAGSMPAPEPAGNVTSEKPAGPPPLANAPVESTGQDTPTISSAAPAIPQAAPKAPKKKSRKGLVALLVILIGFVCGAALASFVLPVNDYVDTARVFLEKKLNIGTGGDPVIINQPVPAVQPTPQPAIPPTTTPTATTMPENPPVVQPGVPPSPVVPPVPAN